MTSSIVILGWTADDKVPGDYRETVFGTGRISVGAYPVRMVVTGTKLATGSAVPDQDIVPIYSSTDAYTKLGAHSTACRQAIAALNIPGVTVYAAPPAAAGGAVAATATVAFGCSWTSPGSVKFWVGGEMFEVSVGATQVAADAGATFRTQCASLANGLVNPSGTTASSTVTAYNLGTQGNSILIYWDLSEAPTGLTVTVTGGTAIHDRLVPLTGGTGTESLANVIALLKPELYDYIGVAQTDATNAGLIKTHLGSEAGPTISHLEHAVFASSGTLVAASSLAQTTLNDYRSCVVWLENSEVHPSEIAASVCAIRSVFEPQNPNFNFDDTPVPGVVPQRYQADKALHATLKAALNSGVTPLIEKNGVSVIARGIVSHCLNGSAPDYRCLDWGDAVVPDRISKELGAEWVSVFKPGNPYVGPDAVGSEADPSAGVGTPNRWKSTVYGILKQREKDNWLQNVDNNLPEVEYDNDRGALVSAVPIEVRKQQHAIGISVRQQAA
jgi:phage tail sheath gpL-like